MSRQQSAARQVDGDLLGLGTVLRCRSECVGVLVEHDERRLITVRAVAAGEILFRVEGRETPTPTRFSVQVGPGLHVDFGPSRNAADRVARYPWRFMNHHCEPSTMIRDQNVIALRDIVAGEDVTFNYNTTEYDMAEPFVCQCGGPRCIGLVRGAKHLTAAQRARLGKTLPDYLR